EASQHAHCAADQHVSLKLVRDLRARLQDGPRGLLVAERSDVLPSDVDLEKTESGEHERDHQECYEDLQSTADFLDRADQPARVEILDQEARDEDAMLFKPVGPLHV